MKTARTFLEPVHSVVPGTDFDDVVARHEAGNMNSADIRDCGEIIQTGAIAGALRVIPGMIECAAEPATPIHSSALSRDADIVRIRGKGGQAALTGKTRKDMGYKTVANAGGFPDWKEKGGPGEDG